VSKDYGNGKNSVGLYLNDEKNLKHKRQLWVSVAINEMVCLRSKNASAPGGLTKGDAGLVKVVVPIFVDHKFLGVAGGCGLLQDEA
jgi:hypothetical protein